MKKFLAALLTLAMLLTSFCLTAFAQEIKFDDGYTLGDVNDDGKINAVDLLCMKAYISGVDGYSMDKDAADITADCAVSTRDAFYLKAYFVDKYDISSTETDNAIDVLTIGGVSIDNFCIVVPSDATSEDNVHYAATRFRKYLGELVNYTPEICFGEANATKTNMIVYHAVKEGDELYDELGTDGYKVEVTDGRMDIYGGLRGNMYCTYDILENYLGMCFYSNTETFVEEHRAVALTSDINTTFVPKMLYRMAQQTFGNNGFQEHFLPMKLNGTQIYSHESNYKYGCLTGPIFINAHSFGYYWRMSTGYQTAYLAGSTPASIAEDYYSNAYKLGEDKETDHGSDWVGLGPWQPCPSTEEDYNNEFEGLCMTIQMKQDWGFTFAETNKIFSFSPLDNVGGLCSCRYCKAKANGSKIRSNATLLSQLENYGGAYTVSGGYVYFEKENYSGLYMDFLNKACYDITHEEKKYYTGTHTYTNEDEEDVEYTLDLGDMTTYYPELQLMSITYDLTLPATIRPAENAILMFCGQGCNHHYLGTEECQEVTTVSCTYYTRTYTNAGEDGSTQVMKGWIDLCHETGAQFWFWYYPVTYSYPLAPTPNIYNMYYDLKWLIDTVGCDGVYYEGGGGAWSFEPLKAHMATLMMYHCEMTFDEFVEEAKTFLHAYYGDGYEEIWQYIEMIQECSDENPHCYINNFSNPTVMYNYDYFAEHYLEMRALLETALSKASTTSTGSDVTTEYTRVRMLIMVCDTIGLESVWDDWYNDGNNVELYESMYDAYYSEITYFGATFAHDATLTEGLYSKSVYTQGGYGSTNIRN